MHRLLDPLEVKGLRLKNRIVMPPMNTEYAKTDGEVTSKLVEHYIKRSKALGLMIIEHSYVSPEGKLSKKQLGMHDDKLVPKLKKLASSIHEVGTPVVSQINHAGASANMEITKTQPVAPSPKGNAVELKTVQIEALVEAFSKAAGRAVRAGFDGVEVHGAHGFLLNQFLSPLTNRRRDKYGGSLENRLSFPLEIVARVKERVDSKLLLYRLGADDMDPAGTQIEDSEKFAVKLEQAGVDIIDVSGGLCGSRPAKLQGTQGYFIPQAQRIKEAVSIPIIGVGGITDPLFADELIRNGAVDLVAVGRMLIKDPEWAVKAVNVLTRS